MAPSLRGKGPEAAVLVLEYGLIGRWLRRHVERGPEVADGSYVILLADAFLYTLRCQLVGHSKSISLLVLLEESWLKLVYGPIGKREANLTLMMHLFGKMARSSQRGRQIRRHVSGVSDEFIGKMAPTSRGGSV